MRTLLALVFGALALSSAACRRPKSSPEYVEASGAYSTLVAKLGDDAYADPEMARIEGLLDKVEADSLDAQAASQLKGTIAAERKRVQEEAAEHQAALDSVAKGTPPDDSPRAASPPPEAAAAADAGQTDALTTGMSVDEARKVTDNCIEFSQTIRVRAVDRTESDAQAWALRDLNSCKDRFPRYVGQVLVFQDGKYLSNFDRGAVRQELVDAGVRTTPAPQAPAPPPGAPQYPGTPQPGAPLPSPGEQTGPAPR
jgi:hypothetical protein